MRQQGPLRRFLDDGRLRLDNNVSERELQTHRRRPQGVALRRQRRPRPGTANLFSLIASCKLHGLDPEAYLRDLFRVLVHWPRDRYLELTPRYWAQTRARLDPRELELPLGNLTVPEAPPKEAAPG